MQPLVVQIVLIQHQAAAGIGIIAVPENEGLLPAAVKLAGAVEAVGAAIAQRLVHQLEIIHRTVRQRLPAAAVHGYPLQGAAAGGIDIVEHAVVQAQILWHAILRQDPEILRLTALQVKAGQHRAVFLVKAEAVKPLVGDQRPVGEHEIGHLPGFGRAELRDGQRLGRGLRR